MSSSNCCFLTCIQISQEADQVVWYSHLFQNFPPFIVIHTVKGFGIVNKIKMKACPYDMWRSHWQRTLELLPGNSHGWRSLVGCSLWGHWELDMTEWLPFHFKLSCIGEGNGHPLQCSCLENPRDGGACWAAVFGVAQSRTWLKWLSSRLSSSNLPLWYVGVLFTPNDIYIN